MTNDSQQGEDIKLKTDTSQYMPIFFVFGFIVVAYLVLKD